MDKRIGIYNPDGSVQSWPEVDALGNTYSRPATTVGVDATHFVIIPPRLISEELVNEARGWLVSGMAAPSRVSKVKSDES